MSTIGGALRRREVYERMIGHYSLRMRVGVLAFIVGVLAFPAVAAGAVVPIDPVPVRPANGGEYAPSNAAVVSFTARWTPPASFARGGTLFVEVTNQNIAGQDGTLADDPQYRVGSGYLSSGDADPTSWTGNVGGSFPATPGTYFAQFYAYGANAACGFEIGQCILASPVFSFTTARATPRVWSASDARSSLRGVIKDGTGRSPVILRRSCARLSKLRFSCRADWRDTKWFWAGRLTLRLDTTANEIEYSFRGQRASRACVKNKSIKRCNRRAAF